MSLEPGSLDRRIVVQQTTESTGDSGFPIDTWSTLDTVWAKKRDLNGSERFGSTQLSSPFDTGWELHYRADIDPELVDVAKLRRIVYQGRAYDIVFGRHLGLKESIELVTLAKGKIET